MEIISEKNKSGDNSLHDWFNKSKSSDNFDPWISVVLKKNLCNSLIELIDNWIIKTIVH